MSKLFKITAPDWKADVPFTLDSDIRLNFTKPVQQSELKNPVGRYTSNKDKYKICKGIGASPSGRHSVDIFAEPPNRYRHALNTLNSYCQDKLL